MPLNGFGEFRCDHIRFFWARACSRRCRLWPRPRRCRRRLRLRRRAPAPAQPLREPSIAPAPDWIEPLPVPAANPALRDRPIQTLLASNQTLYGADSQENYTELTFLIQNAQGLQGLGNITLPWQPDQSELIIHKVQIVRNGTVIDQLAGGHPFTVLRRENGLKSATLDGVLTAVSSPKASPSATS